MSSKVLALTFCMAIAGCGNQGKQGKDDESQLGSTESDNGKMWVTGERLDRRTCPSTSCGVVGRLFFREAANPLESKNGWIRISKPYDAACEGGKSKYVDDGRADCSKANGITEGKFAEWVLASGLSEKRPADPAETATEDEALVAQSDDFGKYHKQFSRLTAKLIGDGRCTKADFQEMGGWEKSISQYRNEPVYFTYCGGMTMANKIYVNAETELVLP